MRHGFLDDRSTNYQKLEFTTGIWLNYRVTKQVSDLSWVDLVLTVSVADGPLLLVMYCPAGSGTNLNLSQPILNLSQPILGSRPAWSPCIHMLLRRIFHPVKKDASPSFSFLPPSGETHPMKEGPFIPLYCICSPTDEEGIFLFASISSRGREGGEKEEELEEREGGKRRPTVNLTYCINMIRYIVWYCIWLYYLSH